MLWWRINRERESLIAALHDEEPSQRWRAAERLASIGGEAARSALVGALGDRHPIVRWVVAESLARRYGRRDCSELLEELKSEDLLRRLAAIDALGMSGNAAALEPLLQLLQEDSQAIRNAAVEALGKLGDTRAALHFVRLWGTEPASELVRYSIIEALRRVAPRSWKGLHQLKQEVQAVLAEGLRDPSPLVRGAAARGAGQLRCVELAAYLEKALGDVDVGVRWQAARALGRVGTQANLPALRALLSDQRVVLGVTVRSVAAQALAAVVWRQILRALWNAARLGGSWVVTALRYSASLACRGLRKAGTWLAIVSRRAGESACPLVCKVCTLLGETFRRAAGEVRLSVSWCLAQARAKLISVQGRWQRWGKGQGDTDLPIRDRPEDN